MSDGKPNLTGLWQAMGTADWDIEAHSAAASPFYQLGALGAIPPGQGIVEGGEIPYMPAALEQKKQELRESLEGGSGSEVLHAGRSARDLFALSVSDRPVEQGHPDRL